nr:hypothetical protein [Burkholderiales bacterium]
MTEERRAIPRTRLKVIHLHREGDEPTRRVSDLVFLDGKPHAVLGWTHSEQGRRPGAAIELDTARLRPSRRAKALFRYEGVTQ